MGYMGELEAELRERLADLPAERLEETLKFIKKKVYESYQNGQAKKQQQAKDS